MHEHVYVCVSPAHVHTDFKLCQRQRDLYPGKAKAKNPHYLTKGKIK
jgi:hypothetical protein